MKILHTADWHIGQFKGPVVDGVNLRSQDTVGASMRLYISAEWVKQRTEDRQANTLMD